MPLSAGVANKLNSEAPSLAAEIHSLVADWLRPLQTRLDRGPLRDIKAKHLNDPVWGTIELYPWEVALLDTPLMQRLRGVRQLGLAQYVFPGAGHDRLEHVCGVVGAVEATIQALRRQIERWNLGRDPTKLPDIGERRRYELRLAGLLHDIGHGPFSHAIEPVIELGFAQLSTNAPALDDAGAWKGDIQKAQRALGQTYTLNKLPSVSETIAVMMVAAEPMRAILGHGNLDWPHGGAIADVQDAIIAAIVGAVEGPGADHLSSVVSSQIDADKLDYLARDAHHAGLQIGFETLRLLAKLEVLIVRPERLDESAEDLRQRASLAPDGRYYDVGIAASGFGSFEQMLIGRTFLYDRLYHHHKVRAADAMAQRLVITAQVERGARFSLSEIFARIGDDTMIRVLGGEITHTALKGGGVRARGLAQAILDRDLYHRAFAFRGRFVACPLGMTETAREQLRRGKWSELVKQLETLDQRLTLEKEIFDLAVQIGTLLRDNFPDDDALSDAIDRLSKASFEQVIVDLPRNKADSIKILARYPNERLAVPEFSFNPIKWADAYDLQKRTGYVFSPRETVPVVGLAAKLLFLRRFGVVMGKDADGFIKASEVPSKWLDCLEAAAIIDAHTAQHLKHQRYSLLRIDARDIPAPSVWLEEDPDFSVRIASQLNRVLPAGLVQPEKDALTKTLRGFFNFMDTWYAGDKVTGNLENERALQTELRDGLRIQGINIDEAGAAGGGEYDLVAEQRILIENKIAGVTQDPFAEASAASMQGRRYAIALGMRVVFVALAFVPKPTAFPAKVSSVLVRSITSNDDRRVEVRLIIPYRAVVPSRERNTG